MSASSTWAKSIVISALLFVGCTSTSKTVSVPAMTTIYVVRHAEKLTTDHDTPLSPRGEARAKALAEKLADAGVQQVYATTLQRTQQTVGPLAEARGLSIITIEPTAVDSLVLRVKATDRGKVVLVAGHNHTVPAIVQGLSGWTVDPIPENVFDRLYRVELPEDGAAVVTLFSYGEPTP